MIELLLAYALFIILLAIPYLVIAVIALAFVAGVAAIIGGVRSGRTATALLGLVLLAASGTSAITIKHWATSPPTNSSGSAHRLVYETYRGMRARQQAMRWLRDGTFTQPAKEHGGRDAERRSPSANEPPR